MQDPTKPQRPRVNREAALAAGVPEDEIAAEDARRGYAPERPTLKRPAVKVANESTTTLATKQPDVAGLANDWPAAIREVGRGVTWGASDFAEAGVRALGPETYGGVRQLQRDERKDFQERSPILAAGLNAGGALLTGAGAAKLATKATTKLGGAALRTLGGNLKVGSGLTVPSRLGSAALNGGVQGGVAAGVSADGDLGDRAIAGGVGALAGAGLGLGFSGVAELLRGGKRVLGDVPNTFRAMRGKPVAIDPDEAAREVVPILARSGKTVDDLRRLSAEADAPDLLAEVMDGEFGKAGTSQLGTAHRYGLQPKVEEVLTTRARNESGRARRALERNGVVRQNAKQLQADKLAEARTTGKPLYDEALKGRTVTDPVMLDLLETSDGPKAWNEMARQMKNRGVKVRSADEVLSGAKVPEPGPDVPVAPPAAGKPSVARQANKDMAPTDDELAYMSPDDLRKGLRGSTPAENLTDRELAVNRHYLEMMDNADAARAGFEDLPVNMQQSETFAGDARMAEDRLGAIEAGGFDPKKFHALNLQAIAAKKRMTARAPRLKALRDEAEARAALAGEPLTPRAQRAANREEVAAHTLPEKAGELPTVPAKQVQRWKLVLDKRIAKLETEPGGSGSHELADMIALRDNVDNLLYEHAPGYDKAQAAYAKPMQERDAFTTGLRESASMDETDIERMLALPKPEWVAKGVGARLHRELSRLPDGRNGAGIANPARMLTGNDVADAKVAVATQRDAAKMADIAKTAGQINRRFKTSHKVLSGSQTADKIADDLQAMGGDMAANVAKGRFAGVIEALWGGAVKGARGASLDRRAAILMAGGKGQMSRDAANDLLEKAQTELLRRAGIQSRGTTSLARQAVAEGSRPR